MSYVDLAIRKIKELGIYLSPRAEEVIRRAIDEIAKELSVSSSSSNASNDRELKYLAEKYPSLVKVCRILAERPHYTRELLDKLNTWGYGLDELRRAVHYGLVKRVWGDCPNSKRFRRKYLWNYITPRGLRLPLVK